ncbi:GMP/IMP nucleotidase [Psychromonas sp. RZ22]|uniref:GMP/IMP nucleotidase n=1 Tax=Psychromonas algarum TaxID=2555643 RepID=UPI0010680B5D|nr:GMP/IMP nucleotidase [Psychromonas sp. RZ22]TEW53924.1 GMP/IMP nucleotidase [Psychromonas sp. RZ22]
MFLEKDVDLVLLDMDGTLLDLHYDTNFWLNFVPQQYSLLHDQSIEQAKHHVYAQYKKVFGTLNWYCYDYWTTILGLDIHQLQNKNKHKIQWREDSLWFLKKLKELNKKIVILTNAHPSGIALKNKQTDLLKYVDLVISSHDIGVAKENKRFWSAVQEQLNTDFIRSVFIDDSEKILTVAQDAGVQYLVGINKPDSEKPASLMQDFPSVRRFEELF